MTWIFRRGTSDHLQITHLDREDGSVALRIDENGVAREQWFADKSDLIDAHTGFERHAVAAGWMLTYFGPERRSGLDRRAAPRTTPERRFRIVGGSDAKK
jgi:hypothetical protein